MAHVLNGSSTKGLVCSISMAPLLKPVRHLGSREVAPLLKEDSASSLVTRGLRMWKRCGDIGETVGGTQGRDSLLPSKMQSEWSIALACRLGRPWMPKAVSPDVNNLD